MEKEYTDFRNFQTVVNKAKDACKNSGQDPLHHIVDFNEEISHGKGAKQIYPSEHKGFKSNSIIEI